MAKTNTYHKIAGVAWYVYLGWLVASAILITQGKVVAGSLALFLCISAMSLAFCLLKSGSS